MAARVIKGFRRTSCAAGATGGHAEAGDELELDQLTSREQEVLNLNSEGPSDKEIAAALNISLYTVKSHVRNILAKLHVNNRREAARLAKKQ